MDEYACAVFDDRTGAKPSISSKKMMEGRILYAWSNNSLQMR